MAGEFDEFDILLQAAEQERLDRIGQAELRQQFLAWLEVRGVDCSGPRQMPQDDFTPYPEDVDESTLSQDTLLSMIAGVAYDQQQTAADYKDESYLFAASTQKKHLQAAVIMEALSQPWFDLVAEVLDGEGLPTMDPDQPFMREMEIEAEELSTQATRRYEMCKQEVLRILAEQSGSSIDVEEIRLQGYESLLLLLSGKLSRYRRETWPSAEQREHFLANAEEDIRLFLLEAEQPIPAWLDTVFDRLFGTNET